MAIDHFGSSIQELFPINSFVYSIPMRLIGRISFPLFAFSIATGLKHTKNLKKYILRLFMFALISTLPFSLFLSSTSYSYTGRIELHFDYINVMFTFLSSAISAYIYKNFFITEEYEKYSVTIVLQKVLSLFAILLILSFCVTLNTDYGFIGAALTFLLFLSKNKLSDIIITAISLYILYSNSNYFYYSLLSIPIILIYNGKRGPSLKWFFYIFYPLHLTIFAFIFIYYENLKILAN